MKKVNHFKKIIYIIPYIDEMNLHVQPVDPGWDCGLLETCSRLSGLLADNPIIDAGSSAVAKDVKS